MATINIASAYRSISVHPDFKGVSRCFPDGIGYLQGTRISFGLMSAPYLFTHAINFIARCMNRCGFSLIIKYLDDFMF